MKLRDLIPFRWKALSPVPSSTPGSGGWISVIREPFTGAWQRNIEIRTDTVLTYSAVFRCIGLISSDVAKMRMRLVQQDPATGIWLETTNPAFTPVLRKPNRWQNRIQFYTSWVESKLIHGNTYALKERDARNVVTALYVLAPELVTVLVAPDGAVFYELQTDNLAGIPESSVTVPASEIIHDRWNTFNHPLVGISPIHACGLAAMQGINIQKNSTKFFANGARPSGLLLAPDAISEEKAERLKEKWEKRYGAGGTSPGGVAVLGGGMKFETMTMTAVDAQLIEQLKWTAETVATVFGVPAYKIGVAAPPVVGSNVEALDAQYYSQCLQIHIESIELALDEGLGLGSGFGNTYGAEFDLEDLLRMDTATKVKSVADAIGAGFMSPNEGRQRFDLKPVQGGDSPYLQQQNFSLRALDKRDSNTEPPTTLTALPAPAPADDEADDDGGAEARAILAADFLRRSQPHYVRSSS